MVVVKLLNCTFVKLNQTCCPLTCFGLYHIRLIDIEILITWLFSISMHNTVYRHYSPWKSQSDVTVGALHCKAVAYDSSKRLYSWWINAQDAVNERLCQSTAIPLLKTMRSTYPDTLEANLTGWWVRRNGTLVWSPCPSATVTAGGRRGSSNVMQGDWSELKFWLFKQLLLSCCCSELGWGQSKLIHCCVFPLWSWKFIRFLLSFINGGFCSSAVSVSISSG